MPANVYPEKTAQTNCYGKPHFTANWIYTDYLYFCRMDTDSLLQKTQFTKTDLVYLLACRGEEEKQLFTRSKEVKEQTVGKGVYMRGLIEISNLCIKDCLYCGIRKSNCHAQRYQLDDQDVINAARFAYEHQYGSVVLQGGERNDKVFIQRIARLLKEIKKLSNGLLGITLSLGEQTEATYRQWFDSGAHRYLLRIETSNEALYKKIHPAGPLHNFHERLACIKRLQHCGYQTGTGVMIGLPFQTIEDLADDLLFLKAQDVDMVGMGPYLEHKDTPLYQYRNLLASPQERLRLGLHMVSCLRLLVPDLNIAATTALQAIDPTGREQALTIGANIVMPNITPMSNRGNYKLYENKPGMDEGAEASIRKLAESIRKSGCEIQFGAWGDSAHFRNRSI